MKLKYKKEIIIVGIIVIVAAIVFAIYSNSKNRIGQTKKVDGLVIENGKIDYQNNISILSADVTNETDTKKTDIRLEITFYDKKKKEITTITGYLGDLETNQSRKLNASVTDDLNHAMNVKYKIVE